MKKTLQSIFYGTIILAATISQISCTGSKNGKLTIDGKAYTISIKEVTYADGHCKIELHTAAEVVKKFEEFNSNPFWLGTISGKEYVSATGKIAVKEGLIFVVEAPSMPDRIIVFTPNQESIAEFEVGTLKAIPNPSAEEIANLIHSVDPELCSKFGNYQPLTSSQNGAGISLSIISGKSRTNTFGMIEYGNIMIKSRQNFANEFTSHFYAVDANNPTKKLDLELRGGHSYDNTEFFGVLMFAGNTGTKYAFVVFEGVPPDALTPELVTPRFFYLVELGEEYTEGANTYTSIKSYCKTPYLPGDNF